MCLEQSVKQHRSVGTTLIYDEFLCGLCIYQFNFLSVVFGGILYSYINKSLSSTMAVKRMCIKFALLFCNSQQIS